MVQKAFICFCWKSLPFNCRLFNLLKCCKIPFNISTPLCYSFIILYLRVLWGGKCKAVLTFTSTGDSVRHLVRGRRSGQLSMELCLVNTLGGFNEEEKNASLKKCGPDYLSLNLDHVTNWSFQRVISIMLVCFAKL